MIERRGIDVRLNTEVTPELAKSLTPDVIIAAMGSFPVVPKIKGIEGPNVMGAEEAYYDPEKVGGSAVILGCGLVGAELGVFFGAAGQGGHDPGDAGSSQ